jgi:hypothetical protein
MAIIRTTRFKALAGAPALPEAAAAFSLATDVTAENADLVDER